jgi:hypothetical protein
VVDRVDIEQTSACKAPFPAIAGVGRFAEIYGITIRVAARPTEVALRTEHSSTTALAASLLFAGITTVLTVEDGVVAEWFEIVRVAVLTDDLGPGLQRDVTVGVPTDEFILIVAEDHDGVAVRTVSDPIDLLSIPAS